MSKEDIVAWPPFDNRMKMELLTTFKAIKLLFIHVYRIYVVLEILYVNKIGNYRKNNNFTKAI